MTSKPKGQTAKDKIDASLDEALEESFPASDPPAMSEPAAADHAPAKPPKRRPKTRRPDTAP
jgi:hypothetical protein